MFLLRTTERSVTEICLRDEVHQPGELPEEPTKQDYGIDFGFRDPFGNQLRVGQTRAFRP